MWTTLKSTSRASKVSMKWGNKAAEPPCSYTQIEWAGIRPTEILEAPGLGSARLEQKLSSSPVSTRPRNHLHLLPFCPGIF